MKTCSKCSRENPDGFVFCGSCGSKLGVICNKCGRENIIDSIVCGYCGVQLNTADEKKDIISNRFSSQAVNESKQQTGIREPTPPTAGKYKQWVVWPVVIASLFALIAIYNLFFKGPGATDIIVATSTNFKVVPVTTKTVRPTRTLQPPTVTSTPDPCVRADKIDSSYENKLVCVYGIVFSTVTKLNYVYNDKTGSSESTIVPPYVIILDSYSRENFLLKSSSSNWLDVNYGDCIEITGIVQNEKNAYYFIDPDLGDGIILKSPSRCK